MGNENVPDVISLSRDILHAEHSDIELTARVIRRSTEGDIINQYITYANVFYEQVRKYGYTKKAVEETLRICRDRNILTEYLRQEEVSTIMFYEVDMNDYLAHA